MLARPLAGPLSRLELLYHGGYVPTLRQLRSDQDMKEFESLKDVMDRGALRPQVRRYEEWSGIFRGHVRSYLIGKEDNLNDITDALERCL